MLCLPAWSLGVGKQVGGADFLAGEFFAAGDLATKSGFFEERERQGGGADVLDCDLVTAEDEAAEHGFFEG